MRRLQDTLSNGCCAFAVGLLCLSAAPSHAQAIQLLDRDSARKCSNFESRANLERRLLESEGPWSGSRRAAIAAGRGDLPAPQISLEREKNWRAALLSLEAKRGLNDPESIQALANLASTVADQGRFREAEILFLDAVGRLEAQPPISTLSSGVFLNFSGFLAQQGRKEDAAEALITAGLYSGIADQDIYRAGIASELGQMNFFMHADSQSAFRCFGAAIKLANSSASQFEEGGVARSMSSILLKISNVALESKLYVEVEKRARQGLDLKRRFPSRITYSDHERFLALALIGLGKPNEAERVARKVVSERAKLVGRSPDRALVLASSLLSQSLFAQSTKGNEALATARSAYEQALALGRGLQVSADQDAQDGALTNYRSDTLLRAVMAFSNSTWLQLSEGAGKSTDLADSGFAALQELTSSRSAHSMQAASLRRSTDDDALAATLRELNDLQLKAQANRQAFSAAMATGSLPYARNQEAAYELLVQQVKIARLKIKKIDPKFAAYSQPEPLSISEVRTRLQPDEALILFSELPDAIHTILITPKQLSWNRAASEDANVKEMVERVLCSIDVAKCSASNSANVSSDQFAFDHASEIYNALVRPVEPNLKDVRRLYVVAQGAMASLPIGILPTRPLSSAGLSTPGLWLAERYAITSLPSVSTLAPPKGNLTHSRQTASGFLGYGAPRLQGSDSASKPRGSLALSRSSGGINLMNPAELRNLPALPGTEVELRAAAILLQAPAQSLFMGERMTERSFRTNPDVKKASLIIVATHGILPGDIFQLGEPGLVFSPPDEASEQDDGLLSASEASELTLEAELVVLSACNTAVESGEDLSELARSFLFAGAKSVLGSHWRVSDAATAALTREFLRASQFEGTRAQALQRGINAVRTGRREDGSEVKDWDPGWADPREWGPFSLIAARDD